MNFEEVLVRKIISNLVQICSGCIIEINIQLHKKFNDIEPKKSYNLFIKDPTIDNKYFPFNYSTDFKSIEDLDSLLVKTVKNYSSIFN